MNPNYLILTQLLLEYAIKTQAIGQLFQQAAAQGRDVTDEEVDASRVSRDVELARLRATLNA